MQWKAASSRLQEVRDRELRALNTIRQDPSFDGWKDENPERNGLVIFQRWMMRFAILQQVHRDAKPK